MAEEKQNGLQNDLGIINRPHAVFFNPPIFDNYLGHQFAEVYKDRIYDPYLSNKKDLQIVDIGANIGVTSYYFSHFGKVLSVEPSLQHFTILNTMVDFNQLTDKIKTVQKAVYCKDGFFDFFHNKNKTMFSLNAVVSDSPDTEKVEAVTMDRLFEENGITHVDLLKLDTEGAEVEIFSSEGFSKVAKMIDVIVTETHSWNGRHPNQIIDALTNNEFEVKKIENDASILVAIKK